METYDIAYMDRKRATTLLGTTTYMAPEVLVLMINDKSVFEQSYTETVDYWSLGIFLYGLLVGKAPYKHYSNTTLQQKLTSATKKHINKWYNKVGNYKLLQQVFKDSLGPIDYTQLQANLMPGHIQKAPDTVPENHTSQCKIATPNPLDCLDFISRLLIIDPQKRLGGHLYSSSFTNQEYSLQSNQHHVRSHSFLTDIKWDANGHHNLKPPLVPKYLSQHLQKAYGPVPESNREQSPQKEHLESSDLWLGSTNNKPRSNSKTASNQTTSGLIPVSSAIPHKSPGKKKGSISNHISLDYFLKHIDPSRQIENESQKPEGELEGRPSGNKGSKIKPKSMPKHKYHLRSEQIKSNTTRKDRIHPVQPPSSTSNIQNPSNPPTHSYNATDKKSRKVPIDSYITVNRRDDPFENWEYNIYTDIEQHFC